MISWRFFAVLLVAVLGLFVLVYFRGVSEGEARYDSIIAVASARYGIDPVLVRAVIWRESRFRPRTLGLSQERGLMQVRSSAALEWAKAEGISNFKVEDLYEPEVNIMAGSWYLARALHHWQGADDPVPFALAEYNAGRRNALRWVDPARPRSAEAFMLRIDFPSTKRYIRQIQGKYAEYQRRWCRPAWEKLLARFGPSSLQGYNVK
jgi:soluble lytic murein transglycosylase